MLKLFGEGGILIYMYYCVMQGAKQLKKKTENREFEHNKLVEEKQEISQLAYTAFSALTRPFDLQKRPPTP